MGNGEPDKLLDHEYDGIREYDNPLPRWWTGLFIATIVFSVVYWLYYHGGGPGVSEVQAYQAEMKAHEAAQAARAAASGAAVDEQALAQLASDPAALSAGRALFTKHCVACHGTQGEGKIGPNLTDDYQLHGSGRTDIFTTIRDGVPAKGMIAWANMLGADELQQVAAYVASLRGKHVQGGKAAQGAKVGPLP